MIGIEINKQDQFREQSVPILSQIEVQEIETARKVSCPHVCVNTADLRRIPPLLAQYGIRILFVEHLQKSKLDGAAF